MFKFGRSTKPEKTSLCYYTVEGIAGDCIRVIAEAIAGLPLNLYKKGGGIDYDHPLNYLLNIAPNDDMTGFDFRDVMTHNALVCGDAYAQILREDDGRVKALQTINPRNVSVNHDQNNEAFYTVREADKCFNFQCGDVLRIRNMFPFSVVREHFCTINEICGFFGVPRHKIGFCDAPDNVIKHMNYIFDVFTLRSWLVQWEQALMRLLSPEEMEEYYFKFNVNYPISFDDLGRIEACAVGVQNGFLSPNEVRRMFGMTDIPGGDSYFIDGHMVPVKTTGEATAGCVVNEAGE